MNTPESLPPLPEADVLIEDGRDEYGYVTYAHAHSDDSMRAYATEAVNVALSVRPVADSIHAENAKTLQAIIDELREMLGLAEGDSLKAAVQALSARQVQPVGEPDWDEVRIQAEAATGLQVEPHTFSIIIREVRRWLDALSQAEAVEPLQTFSSPRGKRLMAAWQEGFAACRDSEFVGAEAQNDAFNRSQTVNHCIAEDILARAPAPAQAVPDWWKLVPVEPTDAMVQAAHHIDLSYMPGQEGADRAAIYRAMLSASPAVSQEGGE